MDEVVTVEHESVQTGCHQQLIAPMVRLSPDADPRIVPGGGKEGVLAFGTIDGEIIQGFMGIIESAYRHDKMPRPYIEFRTERFLDP